METLLEATSRLRSAGYDVEFNATEDGQLRCVACGDDHDPTEIVIDQVVRYEGMSNPDDEAILLALRCTCGRRGLYVTGFGPTATTADVAILPRLR
jgi:hypothetical protein